MPRLTGEATATWEANGRNQAIGVDGSPQLVGRSRRAFPDELLERRSQAQVEVLRSICADDCLAAFYLITVPV